MSAPARWSYVYQIYIRSYLVGVELGRCLRGRVARGHTSFATIASPTSAILPPQFAGWHISGSTKTSKDPAVADAVNAALLKEYGLTDFESGTYTRDDGRKVALKAIRFADASGAYGAFTYYKMPQMLKESIPDQGSSLNERVLFYRGNILVDAVFEKLSAMSAAELRDLSEALPLPAGNTRNLPSLPAYLPKSDYVTNTAKYVVGPVGLEKISAPLSAQLVDFNSSAEVATGHIPDLRRARHPDADRVSDAAAGGGTSAPDRCRRSGDVHSLEVRSRLRGRFSTSAPVRCW